MKTACKILHDCINEGVQAMKKASIWDIFTILVLVAGVGLLGIFAQIFIDPQHALNPFPPPTMVPTVAIPTSTPTFLKLPPTWTATPGAGTQVFRSTLRPSQTVPPSATVLVLSTYTNTPTATNTPTNTPTVTNTPTATKTPTITPQPTYTKLPTYTPYPTAVPPTTYP